MAITRVRVKFNGVWTTLTYNAAAARYEGTILPTATSRHQPGGYYSLEADVTNSSGETTSVTAALPSLRLVVVEKVLPALRLVSPAQGYLTTLRPTVVMDATDEAGGSGVDPASFTAEVDGAEAAGGKSAAPISGGYRLTFTPLANLSEGPHTITFRVADLDGNRTSASAAYTLDVTPPALELTGPDSHRVVDDEAAAVSGLAADSVSGPPAVTVSVNGVERAAPALGEGGRFAPLVPLEIGVNEIKVTAVDRAGLLTSRSFVMIRLVTDRTEADVEKLRDLYRRRLPNWTEAERDWFWNTRCRRGGYDSLDMARVTAAMAFIDGWMASYGQATGYEDARPGVWGPQDGATERQGSRYIRNVEALRDAYSAPEGTPETPEALFGPAFGVGEANAIEAILVAMDGLRPLLERSWFQSGEIVCGES